MKDEDSKAHAQIMLEAAGYSVTSIPPSKTPGQKSADLKATFEQEVLIVEAKSKDPHQEYLHLLNEVQTHGRGDCSREVVAWNALSSVAEKASLQLEATPAAGTAVRILWISCLHDDWEFIFDAFRHRLYGNVELVLFQKTGGLPKMVGTRPCYYYDPSDFFRFQSIDAAVFAGPKGAQVLVNEFGSRVRHVRATRLYSGMKDLSALCDPQTLRESGEALAILDPPRNKSKWQYLLETYGFMTSVLHSYHYKALISVNIDSDE